MKPLAILSFSVAALMLSACGMQQQADKQEDATVQKQTQQKAPEKTLTEVKKNELKIKEHTEVNIALYQCEQGIGQIEVRFFPVHGVAVLVLDGNNHELQQQPAASGFWYSNGKYTLRGKGAVDAWLEIGRRAPIDCQAQGA